MLRERLRRLFYFKAIVRITNPILNPSQTFVQRTFAQGHSCLSHSFIEHSSETFVQRTFVFQKTLEAIAEIALTFPIV